MSVTQPGLRRGVALGVIASMTSLGVVALSPAAQADTGPVTYTCATSPDPTLHDFRVTIDSDAPAKMYVGESFTPTMTWVMRVPRSVIPSDPDPDSVDGTATGQGDVNGLALPPYEMAIARTLVPVSGDLWLTATGRSAPLTPTAPGDLVMHAGDFSAELQFYTGDTATGTRDTTCTRPPGQPPTIDTIVVAAKSSTTLTLAKALTAYGEELVASAKVTTTGGTPDGDVAFVVNGVATKARVDKDGIATTTIKGLPTGNHVVSASFVPKDAVHYDGSSTANQSVVVTKADTRTRAGISGKRTNKRLRVHARVKTEFDTTATGKVRIKLQKLKWKNGEKRWAKVRTKVRKLIDGKRTVGFGRLAKGRYRVKLTYRGDDNHERSRKTKQFRVKPARRR